MRTIDGKYHIQDDEIVKTSTGEILPRDEPLMLFRARDILAELLIWIYQQLCQHFGCTSDHVRAVGLIACGFREFKQHNPDKMKQPGSTMK